jgi:hypothetical protein
MAYNALNPPPLVHDKPANEVMRVAVHNGELHLSLRRGFDDPGVWGLLLVDAARHVARAYAHDKIVTEDQALERIRDGFEKAIRQPPEGSAETTEIKDAP